ESGGEQGNRAQQSRDRVALFKELDRQDRGQAPENIEVIPFDDVSDRRGDDPPPEVLRNLWTGHCRFLLLLFPPSCSGFSFFRLVFTASSLHGTRCHARRLRTHF